MSLLYKLLYRWVEWTCGISLPYTVKVGRRVRIWHHGAMILNAKSIGNDCHIRHSTTFGVARTHANGAIPTIGDEVDIGVGVCILGNVQIGNGAVIGANSVVLCDIVPGGVAVGVPAKVVKVVKK